jgi:eukaryotic-like serine/threonine-protein kinase
MLNASVPERHNGEAQRSATLALLMLASDRNDAVLRQTPHGTTVETTVGVMAGTGRSLELVRTLGAGGMGTVHLALLRDGATQRIVAIKLPHSFVGNSTNAALLAREASVASRIRHRNVVAVTDYFDACSFPNGDSPVLVMEWVDGVDLAGLQRAASACGRRLPLDVVSAIACNVLAGLHAAHESVHENGGALEIVHRDVSPENVLVGFDGMARVTDFGVAKGPWRCALTESGAVMGKLRYIAPEQLDGHSDRRSDVFGAGAVLWELLTGARLRPGEGVEVLIDILYGRVDTPSTRAPEAAPLDDVVMRALERCADDRFATAAEMAAAIARTITPASAARVGQVVGDLLSGGRVAA